MKKISFHWGQLLSFAFCLLYMVASIICPHLYNTAYKVIVMVMGILGILQSVKINRMLQLNRIDVYWILFTAWSFVSLFWSRVLVVNRLFVFLFIEFNLIFLGNYLLTENRCINMIKAYMLTGFFFGIYLINYFSLKSIIAARRLPSDKIDSNEAGVIFSFSLILSLFFWIREKKKWYLLFTIFFVMMVFLSGSRSAFLNSACSAAVFFLVFYKNQIKLQHILLAVLMVIGTVYLLLDVEIFYNIIGNRMEEMWNIVIGKSSVMSNSSRSTYLRANLYIMSWKTFLAHPLGVGLDNFRYVNSIGRGAHSNIFELLASLGFIGVILFYAIYMHFIHCFLKVKNILDKEEQAIIWAFLMGSFIISLFNSYYNIFSHFVLLIVFYMKVRLVYEGKIEKDYAKK